jgi:hypothetical protein
VASQLPSNYLEKLADRITIAFVPPMKFFWRDVIEGKIFGNCQLR